MSGNWYTKNLSALLKNVLGAAQSAQTSGATSEISGLAIDRSQGGVAHYSGIMASFAGQATLASGVTLSVIANFQHSDSSTQSFVDVGTALSTTLVLTAAGGALTAAAHACKMTAILSEMKQWVRVQFTPVFSSTGTDTCTVQTQILLFGAQDNPAGPLVGQP